MVPTAEPNGTPGSVHMQTGCPADGHSVSVDAVFVLWYDNATVEPMALMNGTGVVHQIDRQRLFTKIAAVHSLPYRITAFAETFTMFFFF